MIDVSQYLVGLVAADLDSMLAAMPCAGASCMVYAWWNLQADVQSAARLYTLHTLSVQAVHALEYILAAAAVPWWLLLQQ